MRLSTLFQLAICLCGFPLLQAQQFETDRLAKSLNDTYVCQVGQSLTLIGDTSSQTHSWSFDGGTGDSTSVNPSVSWSNPGQKTIVYSNGNRTDTIRSMITVYPDLSQPDFTFDLANLPGGNQIKLGNVPPGSVVHLTGTFTEWKVYIKHARGTAAQPIYLTNGDSLVTIQANNPHGHSILFIDNQHLTFTGNGHPSTKYGIRVIGHGIATVQENDHLEISGVEILQSAQHGMLLKNDGLDRTSNSYSGFRVHNNRVAGCQLEGFYIGRYTYYWAGNRQAFANAPYAHSFKDLQVYRNELIDCEWDGIQIGCADSAAVVHDNVMIGSGKEGLNWHGFGLVLSSGFAGEAFHNYTKEVNGLGGSVQIYPFSDTRFYNNTIYAPSTGGIFMRTEPNYLPTGTTAYLHTDSTMKVELFGNSITCGEEALYLLDNVKTPENFLPDTPVPIDTLLFIDNTIDAPIEFLYSGDTSNYEIDNEVVSLSLDVSGSVLMKSITTEEGGEKPSNKSRREPSWIFDASLEFSGYMDGPPALNLEDDPNVYKDTEENITEEINNNRPKRRRKLRQLRRKLRRSW